MTGDGGTIVVWADQRTQFDGALSARGGTQRGRGGFAEVSAKDALIYRGTVDLRAERPAGHARFDEVAREIVGDFAGEAVNVMRAFGAGADEAEIAAEDVPELGEFVEIPAAQEGADAEEAGVVARGADGEVVGGGGVGAHAAQFPESERTAVGTDASLPEQHGAAG